jgi:hypothetical protein
MGGLAFMDWQIGALVGVGAGVAALFDGERRWRSALLVVAGGVLCLVPVVIYYAANGALDVAFEQTVLASLARGEEALSRFTTWDRVLKVWGLAADYCPERQWLLVLGLAGLFVAPRWIWRLRRDANGRMLVVLVLFHSGVLAFSLADFQKFGDFFLVVHSMAFFLGLAWLALYRGVSDGLEQRGILTRKRERGLAAVVLVVAFLVARPAFLTPEIEIRVRSIAPGTTLEDQRQVAAQVRERTRGQRLVMLGAAELLYLMRYVNPLPLVYFNRPALSMYGHPGETLLEAMYRVILSSDPDAFILPGPRRLSHPQAQAEIPRFSGYVPEIVSTAAGRYGVVLYTRIGSQMPEATP